MTRHKKNVLDVFNTAASSCEQTQAWATPSTSLSWPPGAQVMGDDGTSGVTPLACLSCDWLWTCGGPMRWRRYLTSLMHAGLATRRSNAMIHHKMSWNVTTAAAAASRRMPHRTENTTFVSRFWCDANAAKLLAQWPHREPMKTASCFSHWHSKTSVQVSCAPI